MISQLISLATLVFARGIEHRIIYHIEVLDGHKTVVSQDLVGAENHPERYHFMLNYRELVIKLSPSKVEAEQINNELEVGCNSSILDGKGLIVGEQDLNSQSGTRSHLGDTEVFDIGEKTIELVQTPKEHTLAKNHLLVSISYKNVLEGLYSDAPVPKPAPKDRH